MSGTGRRATAVLAAVTLGAVAFSLAPATAAGRFLTKKKALKLFYPRAEADSRFVDTGEKAADSDKLDGQDSTAFLGVSGKAADADELDGKDSTAFQEECKNGAVQAWADFGNPGSLGTSYSNVASSFNCTGLQIQARRSSAGVYLIDFGGVDSAPCQPRVVTVNTRMPSVAMIPVVGFIVVEPDYDDVAGPGLNCVVRVITTDDSAVQADMPFQITLMRPTPFFIPFP